MNVIDYVGWLGFSNLGDEALFLVAKNLFSSYKLNPEDHMNIKSCSGISILGGGTLFPMYTTRYRLNNRYNYAFGVGVRNPSFWGPFDPVVIEQIRRYNFRFIGVRGNISKNLLDSWGIHSEVIGDPALILTPNSYTNREEKVVINIDLSIDELWGNKSTLLKEIIKLCNSLKKQYELVLVPFSQSGYRSIAELSEAVDVPIFENWMDIQSTLNLMSSAKFCIGQRLHSVIFSACSFTPFISLAYRPKCIDFAESVGFEKYALRTDQASFKNTATLFSEMNKNWDALHERLEESVENYRKLLRSFARRIQIDIESLPANKWLPLGPIEQLKRTMLCAPDQFCINHAEKNFVVRAWNKSYLNSYLARLKTEIML